MSVDFLNVLLPSNNPSLDVGFNVLEGQLQGGGRGVGERVGNQGEECGEVVDVEQGFVKGWKREAVDLEG